MLSRKSGTENASAHDQPRPLVAQLGGARRGFGILANPSPAGALHHIIARLAHRGDEIGMAHRARHIAHRGLLVGIVDRRLDHALDLIEAALDRVGAVGAGHAQQRQLYPSPSAPRSPAACTRSITSAGHGLHVGDRRVEDHRHFFVGKVDGGAGDAFHFLGCCARPSPHNWRRSCPPRAASTVLWRVSSQFLRRFPAQFLSQSLPQSLSRPFFRPSPTFAYPLSRESAKAAATRFYALPRPPVQLEITFAPR